MILHYLLAWFGMLVLAILNGGLRDLLYGPLISELAAHQLSTVVLLLLFTGYFRLLMARWPLHSTGEAWAIGLFWLVMTIAFETLTVRVIQDQPWERVLTDYNLAAGRLWLLVPLWTIIGPPVMFRLKR